MKMRSTCLAFAALFFSQLATAQLTAKPVCPTFSVDIMEGTVNGLFPKSAIIEIQTTLPCFTGMFEKDSVTKCAGVFYTDRDINFYTNRRYIEIGEKFKGKLTPALMGTARGSLFSLLGYPKLKDAGWDAYQMGYGCLVLYYNAAGKINKIQISNRAIDALKLCE
ncbi:MAG: hypothetical protein ACKOU7_07960 [Ferruginibacter sp.]